MLKSILLATTLLASSGANAAPRSPPSDWPATQQSPVDCASITGSYVDPNAVRRFNLVSQEEHSYSTQGGPRHSAWLALGLFGNQEIFRTRRSEAERTFSIGFSSNRALLIAYALNDKVVATKQIAPDQYTCKDGVVRFVAYRRTWEPVYDKLPNIGMATQETEIFRFADHLYVHHARSTKALFFGFIPSFDNNEGWACFPDVNKPALPALPPSRSFRWDMSQPGNVLEQAFVVTQARQYQFDIEFHYSSDGAPSVLSNFTGTPAFTDASERPWYTKDVLNPQRVTAAVVGGTQRLEELARQGKIAQKPGIPGMILPIHIYLTKINAVTGQQEPVVDMIANTEGVSHFGDGVISRRIHGLALQPGRYSVLVEPLRNIALPRLQNVTIQSALGISYIP